MPPVINPGQRPRALAAAISLALAASGAHAATFSVTSSDDAGPGTLRQAILDANSQAGPHVIEMSAISGDTITLASGLPHIYGEDVELQGSQVTLSGDNQHECLGVVYAALSVADITVTECSYSGIWAYASDLEISDSTITGNNGYYGGGVDAYFSNLTISDSTISNNSAASVGGGIYANGNLTISNSVISDNSAGYEGGGLLARAYGTGASAHIEHTVVSGNDADNAAGLSVGGFETASLINSHVSDNTAGHFSGGIEFFIEGDNAQLTISGSTLSGNSAANGAGAGRVAFASYDGSAQTTVHNTTISSNSGGDLGGLDIAMFGSGNEAVFIDGVTVTDNDGDDVGGLGLFSYLGGSAGFEIRNSIIAGNTSSGGDADLGMLQGGPSGPASAFGSGANSGPSATQVDINVNYTLLGTAPSAPEFILDAVSQALVGEDPVLGPLADNGGPTPTHLPGNSGAGVDVIPSGTSGCGDDFNIDQHGDPRPEPGGSDCDLGSVELQDNGGGDPDPEPRAVPVPVNQPLALGILAFGAGLLGLLGLRRRRDG